MIANGRKQRQAERWICRFQISDLRFCASMCSLVSFPTLFRSTKLKVQETQHALSIPSSDLLSRRHPRLDRLFLGSNICSGSKNQRR